MPRPRVLLLPGGGLPADLAYAQLLEALGREYERIASLPADELQRPFVRIQLAPGVEPPPEPEGPRPPWAANRPAGLEAAIPAMRRHRLDLEALAAFPGPVYYALGGRSNPVQFERIAERLAGVFPDFTLEHFPERHHFDPPHRAEPERLAASLVAVWSRAEE